MAGSLQVSHEQIVVSFFRRCREKAQIPGVLVKPDKKEL